MRKEFWSTATELPQGVFEAWHKPGNVISPVAVLATVDENGTPRTAPFGSLRAITPRLLRLCSLKDHDSYTNLCRDGRVSIALISPPDIAVSVRGQARLVKEHLEHDPHFAILEVDIEEVKNDMAYRIVIDSAIAISAKEQFQPWYDALMTELGSVSVDEA
jgi:predicted pyridoxine 5'-phosphate oxidase superfamily flavin-nucleotide-binding protein